MAEKLRIALAGLGTVGMGVIGIIEGSREQIRTRAGRELEITAVSARDKNKKREHDTSKYHFETDPAALAATDADVVIELMGGAEGAAKTLVEAALAAGKHVVTANKALIATHGVALAKKAEEKNVALAFEAAVAGGIPVLKLLREGLAANNATRVMGILNGTCNYILTGMWEDKRPFENVLFEAQRLGYAEADPTFDVDGIDTSHKLAILTALAYGTAPDLNSLSVEGIRGITLKDMEFANELGYVVKLLGISSKTAGGILQRVHPCMVAKNTAIASVRGVFNAVQIDGDAAGNIFVEGRGAGGAPTASAVVADLIDIARGHISPAFGVPANTLKPLPSADMAALDCAYYVRLGVVDKPGVLADITGIFRDSNISLKSFLQHGHAPGEKVYIVGATHVTREKDMQAALAKMAAHPSVMEPPFLIRIEE